MLDGVRHASCALLRCQREEDARITELFMRPIEFCMRPLELFIAGFHLCLPPICSGLPNLQPSYRSQCPYRRGTKCGELAQHLHKDLSLALSLARSLSLSLSLSLPPSLPPSLSKARAEQRLVARHLAVAIVLVGKVTRCLNQSRWGQNDRVLAATSRSHNSAGPFPRRSAGASPQKQTGAAYGISRVLSQMTCKSFDLQVISAVA